MRSLVLSAKALVRQAFFELFAWVKGVDVVGPTIVREIPANSPYQAWLAQARAEIPLHEGPVIDDVAHISLPPWPQLGEGITGLYLRFAGHQIIDGRILEIAPGKKTANQRQFCEMVIYIVAGSGYTILQQEGHPEQTLHWSRGGLFPVPLNVRHQHFSTDDGPARILVVSSFPFVLNALGSEAFITDNTFAFTERYDGSPDYFKPCSNESDLQVSTNFVEDISCITTRSFEYRGKGNKTIRLLMAGNSMLNVHVSEMPPRSCKKAHRQSGNAYILLLSGEGFSLSWPEGAYHKKKRVDWKAGTLFAPADYWYHQNLNSGLSPARYLAINTPTLVRNIGLRFSDQLEVDIDKVRLEWEKELEKTAREH